MGVPWRYFGMRARTEVAIVAMIGVSCRLLSISDEGKDQLT